MQKDLPELRIPINFPDNNFPAANNELVIPSDCFNKDGVPTMAVLPFISGFIEDSGLKKAVAAIK